ncbi:phage antirepressor N-terminal domain-containing protein [Clostridium sp. Mt-5]|uniref:Phage antirepressor N-terminal domain-containing protein n=1 Tax=Clostridium moutaii TaxID=3240932 RepID=A0ABV4BSW8_9CLOT
MNDLIIKNVNFETIDMLACKTKDKKIFVGIKSICGGLGIDYSSQLKRIGRDDVLPEGMVKMTIPSISGNQETNMMDIDYLPFFLIGIKASMCRKEVRSKLKEFKLKAKDILAQAFIRERQYNGHYLLQREAGKIVRNMLTDTIKDKIPDSPHKKFAYPNYTKLIYKILFNKTAGQLREERKVPKRKSLRDYLNFDELKEVQELENIITGLISLGMGYDEIKDILNQKYIKKIA